MPLNMGTVLGARKGVRGRGKRAVGVVQVWTETVQVRWPGRAHAFRPDMNRTCMRELLGAPTRFLASLPLCAQTGQRLP